MTTLELALAALAAVNLVVSFAVWRSALYETAQRRLQYLLIWLLPLLGAIVAWVVLRNHSGPEMRRGDGITGNPYVPWNDPGESDGHGGSHHGGHEGHWL